MRKPSNCGHYEHCFPQYSKQSEFQSVLEQHRSVKGEVVDNDNKIVEVNLTHQIKDILLDLNKQLSQEQDEHKNTAEQRNQFKVNTLNIISNFVNLLSELVPIVVVFTDLIYI